VQCGWSNADDATDFAQDFMRSIIAAALVLTSLAAHPALAQGMHDWGLWFCTLFIIGVVSLFIFLLIILIRKLLSGVIASAGQAPRKH
ncbi:MAG: hypothetical protein HC869_20290, partial [Rhodospirillales bacterium]|nr:hypothetical protein [Rhodospirillales bacterium]